MLDSMKLSRWISFAAIEAHARKTAESLAVRWDVPQHDPKNGVIVPLDLRDTVSRYFRLAPDAWGRQGRVAGRMLPEDLLLGSFSSAVPLLFALVPILGMLALLLGGPDHTGVQLFIAAFAIPILVLIAGSTERKMWAIGALFFGLVLPLVGGAFGTQADAKAAIHSAGPSATLWILAPLGVLGLLALLLGGVRGARVRMMLGVVTCILLFVGVSALVPDFLRPVVLAVPGCFLGMAWAKAEDYKRANRLAKWGKLATFENSDKPLAIEGRRQQAERAAKDPSPLIHIGTATGQLSRLKWCPWAPDAGLPVVLPLSSLWTHYLIQGSTGRGKTTSLLIPLVVQYLRANGGGCLIMDGKGSLATIFRRLKNYLLIDPLLCTVGLYENLDSAAVARILRELNVSGTQTKDKMWDDLAFDLSRHSAVLLEALVLISKDTPKRPWHWTMHDHHRLGVMGQQQGGKEEQELMSNYMTLVEDHHPSGRDGLLKDAITYFRTELPAMPENVRGSVITTFTSWLGPATSHPDLLPWTQSEHGVSVEDCLHGRPVGINLPESRYSRAGQIAAAFLKNRVYNQIRRRADAPEGNWRALDPKATPVLVVIDEAHLLLGESDFQLAPIARSLSCALAISTQTLESLRATSTNQNMIDAFLDAFQSWATLNTSFNTVKYLQDRMGTVWVPQMATKGIGVDVVGSVLNVLEAPIFEQGHPQRNWMRHMLRQGAGGFRDTQMQLSDATVEEDLAFDMRLTAADSWRAEPVIDLADFSKNLSQQGMALVSVMRSGAPRRDFVRLDQVMDRIPDDMIDPDFVDTATPVSGDDFSNGIPADDATVVEATVAAFMTDIASTTPTEEEVHA